jgi:beta-lactamase class A
LQRRTFVSLAGSSLTVPGVALGASAGSDSIDLSPALQRYLNLPGTKSYVIRVGAAGAIARYAHQPTTVLFSASAFKTFVLGQYLLTVENGQLSEAEQWAVDDQFRSLGSPVLTNLSGSTEARSVLEAMIMHSDNTATDITLAKVGTDRVRDLIAQLGLSTIRIPDSTRIFASYLVGASPGVDLGWQGINQAFENPPPTIRPPLNDVITLAGSARDFVVWYEYVLGRQLFQKPETLTEFRRIQAASVQIPEAIPEDTLAYVKGGEVVSLNGFNAKSFAGQILVGTDNATPVTFCFLVNWEGPLEDFESTQAEYFASIKNILATIKQSLSP